MESASESSVRNYVREVVEILHQRADDAKERSYAEADRDGIYAGRADAYAEVLSTMQNQAEVFLIPLEELGLAGFDPFDEPVRRKR